MLIQDRRLWPNVRGYHCISSIREEDHFGTTQARQRRLEGTDRGYTCLDSKVPYARGMGAEAWDFGMRMPVMQDDNISQHDKTGKRGKRDRMPPISTTTDQRCVRIS